MVDKCFLNLNIYYELNWAIGIYLAGEIIASKSVGRKYFKLFSYLYTVQLQIVCAEAAVANRVHLILN